MPKTLLNTAPPIFFCLKQEGRKFSAKFPCTEMWILTQNIYSETAFVTNGKIFSASKGFCLSGKELKIVTGDLKEWIHFPKYNHLAKKDYKVT